MRIFLAVPRCLNPKQTYREYPLGAGLVATSLVRLGHEVLLHDQAVEATDDDQLLRRIEQFDPQVVGW